MQVVSAVEGRVNARRVSRVTDRRVKVDHCIPERYGVAAPQRLRCSTTLFPSPAEAGLGADGHPATLRNFIIGAM
jgi:hypothetical protein